MRRGRPLVAMVTDAIAPYHRGGKEQRYQELAPRLAQYAEVHVYSMRWWGSPGDTTRDGVTYHAISPLLPLYRGDRRSIAQALVFALACLRLLFARFDVIEADHMPYLQLFTLKLVAVLRRKRLVVTWHEVWSLRHWIEYLGPAGLLAWMLEQMAMRLPDCIIAASPHTGDRLRERIGARVPVIVAPNGIDLELVMRTPSAPESVDIVSVGRFLRHKRFDLLLDCIAELAGRGVERSCRIIGDGPERDALKARVRRLGIGHLVEFRHDVHSPEELLALVKASKVFVFPSEREGFGIAALEAIACGVPVVTTTAPNNLAQHLVGRSDRGVVCEPTAQALASAVEAALADGGAPHPNRSNDWLEEFDWSVIAARIAHALMDGHFAVERALPRETSPAPALAVGHKDPFAIPPTVPTSARQSSRAATRPERWAPPAAAASYLGAESQSPQIDGGATSDSSNGGAASQNRHVVAGDGAPSDGGWAPDRGGMSDGSDVITEELPRLRLPAAPPRELVPPPEPKPPRRWPGLVLDLLVSALALAALVWLAHVRHIWVLQATEFFLLLLVPGTLLLRAMRISPSAVSRFPLYIPCASLAVIMCSGLGVDLIGPDFGLRRPLSTAPLTYTLGGVCLVLIAASIGRRTPRLHSYYRGSTRVWQAWPLVLPVIAWIGAMRLNNGHSPAVAIAAAGLSGFLLLVGAWRAHRWSISQSSILIYGAGLALIWGFSLRGHFAYGFDIATEYQTFTGVLHAGRWYASHHNDPYGAMLSLTVLPSTFVDLTGASALLVLKAIYPFLFALFPVGVFLVATRVLSRRFAYLAALFIVVQSYYFQQMPGIARQEIALLFFVALVFALLDVRLRQGFRIALIAVMALGMILSHYATTYLAAGMFVSALVLEVVRGRVMSRPRRFGLVPLLAAVAFTAGPAAIWNSPVTHSAQNLTSFFSDLSHRGLAILPNSGGNIVHSYVGGNLVARVVANQYESLAFQDYAQHRSAYIHPLPQAFNPSGFRLAEATDPGQQVFSHPTAKALDVEQLLISQVAILLAVVGAFLMWLRRDIGDTGRVLAVLGVSTLSALAMLRFSGTASDHYNQERAFLEAMVPLAVCLSFMLARISGWRRLGRLGAVVPALFALGLGVLFVSTSGLGGVAAGGGTPTNLANTGDDFDRYYFTEPEFAAANWLNTAAAPGEIIFADRYGALRIRGATGRVTAVFPDVTPLTLDRHAWIYADAANLVGYRTRGEEGTKSALYRWPSFIGRYWNLVYSNGTSAVYARTH